MQFVRKAIAISLASLILTGGMVAQRPQDNRRAKQSRRYQRPEPHGYKGGYVRHNNWKRGYRMSQADWGRGMVIADYRTYNLSVPPRGYQWRYIDGNYVLAAVATGIISSVIIGAMVR